MPGYAVMKDKCLADEYLALLTARGYSRNRFGGYVRLGREVVLRPNGEAAVYWSMSCSGHVILGSPDQLRLHLESLHG